MPTEEELIEARLRDAKEVLAQVERAEANDDHISGEMLRHMGVNPELTRYLNGGASEDDAEKLQAYIKRLEQDLNDLRGGADRIQRLQDED